MFLFENCDEILIYIEYFDVDKLIWKVCTRMSTFLINLIWYDSNICALKLDCYWSDLDLNEIWLVNVMNRASPYEFVDSFKFK